MNLNMNRLQRSCAEWNILGLQGKRDSATHIDGGLYDHVALTFGASFNTKYYSKPIKHFTYPVLNDVKRAADDADLAFMAVFELGSLIRSKQLTSVELVRFS